VEIDEKIGKKGLIQKGRVCNSSAFFKYLYIGVYVFGQEVNIAAISPLFSDHGKCFDMLLIY